jgi:hypothetical protein
MRFSRRYLRPANFVTWVLTMQTPTVASLLAKMPKDAGKRSQVLMGELLAAVRRLSGAAADEKPGTTEPSINDLATEGLPPSAADPVSSKEDIRPSTSQGASPHASDAAKEAESKATPSKKTKKAATSTSTNPSAATATDSQSPTTEAPPASPHKIDDMSRALLRKILARQPVKCFGIDDTGEWRFAIETGVTPTLIACGVPHMYQQLITLGQVPRAGGTWVRSEFEFSQFTTVMVYEGGVVDIIFLDGAWWRCSKEGKLYTIRDRLVVL